MKIQNYLAAIILGCFGVPGYADTNAEAEKNIRHTLQQLAPGESVTRIRTTPFGNLYEVLLGPSVIYMSGDGRFILKGDDQSGCFHIYIRVIWPNKLFLK